MFVSEARIHPLDRLDDQASLIRLAFLDMAVATALQSPTLRFEAFNASAAAGLLICPIATFMADFDAVIRSLVDRSEDFGRRSL